VTSEKLQIAQGGRGGWSRVVFAVVTLLLPALYPGLSRFYGLFVAYLCGALISLWMISHQLGGRARVIVGVCMDFGILTFIVHRFGSTSTPLLGLYLLVPILYMIVVGVRAGAWIAAFGFFLYSLVVGLEYMHVLPTAPDVNVPALKRAPSRLDAMLAVSFVGLLMVVAVVVVGRLISALNTERARSEALLRNVLPEPIADRLKDAPNVIADSLEEATVLFADVVGFTTIADKLPPEEIVAMLNHVFHEFDDLAERHGLEKIKTIGDAYMVVGGLPEPSTDHAERVAEMALALSEELRHMKSGSGDVLTCRMGIHTGPAVAGVIGSKKFIYDVWGDTVNTASRMESHGIPNRIQVTEPVFRRLTGRYRFEPRGVIDVKGKGPMETWFLLGRA
jgi:class 3 adenylate cyclase